MSSFNWCHGPTCHTSHTQDRIRGVKGSKVLRTRKISENRNSGWYRADSFMNYFCSNHCYNAFANKHIQEITAIAPRTEALETPIEVTRTPSTDWGGRPCIDTTIKTVDNDIG